MDPWQIQAIESANGFNIAQGECVKPQVGRRRPTDGRRRLLTQRCRYLTGEEPSDIKANASTIDHDGRFEDVEENLAWTMKFPSGIIASCNTTYGANMGGYYRVHGSKGALELTQAFGYQGQHLTAHIGRDQVIDESATEHDPAHFTRQANYFADCIQQNKTPKPSEKRA